MNAGHLRHRLIFQSNTGNTLSASGEPSVAYNTDFTVWGALEQPPEPSAEVMDAERVAGVAEALIRVRQRPGINSAQRILHKREGSTLFAGINSSVTSVVINEALKFELGPSDYLLIDNEIVRVTAGGAGTTLTIERGSLNTTAASHSTGAAATRVHPWEIVGTMPSDTVNEEVAIRVRRLT